MPLDYVRTLTSTIQQISHAPVARHVSIALGAGLLALFWSLQALPAKATLKSRGLDAIHLITAARYSRVEHISSDDLARLLDGKSNDVVLFDVREPDEHAVSTLPGAIRISPSIAAVDFAKRFGDRLKGRNAIFFCSVGVRSTQVASRILRLQQNLGLVALQNLRGGIFNWHNEARPLAGTHGKTDLVHPYNTYWSRLLNRRDGISYKPASASQSSNQ